MVQGVLLLDIFFLDLVRRKLQHSFENFGVKGTFICVHSWILGV